MIYKLTFKALNALCDGLINELNSTLEYLDTCENTGAIVITGSEKVNRILFIHHNIRLLLLELILKKCQENHSQKLTLLVC